MIEEQKSGGALAPWRGKDTPEIYGPWRFRLLREWGSVMRARPIADGALFQDGTCILRWRTKTPTTGIYSSLADLLEIHGHAGTEVEWLDVRPTEAFKLGVSHCTQDGWENAPFASVGGLESRGDLIPKYARPGEEAEYLRGYIACALDSYGEDWQTCTFSWAPAVIVNAREPAASETEGVR